jgi:arginine utilization protein RocB
MSKKLNKAMAVVLGVVSLWSMNATADERSFGPALKTLLTDDSYFSRYGIDNPNTDWSNT